MENAGCPAVTCSSGAHMTSKLAAAGLKCRINEWHLHMHFVVIQPSSNFYTGPFLMTLSIM